MGGIWQEKTQVVMGVCQSGGEEVASRGCRERERAGGVGQRVAHLWALTPGSKGVTVPVPGKQRGLTVGAGPTALEAP